MMTSELLKSSNELLFGHLTQSRLIMERNFEGQHFLVGKAGQPKLDCMFFPATQGERVSLDPGMNAAAQNSQNISASMANTMGSATTKYLNKSTIIMCNPNALIYQ
jgi:hypothetical protein